MYLYRKILHKNYKDEDIFRGIKMYQRNCEMS